ncbi:hypothetical protein ACLM5H_03040 [Fredinandcohnia humi]
MGCCSPEYRKVVKEQEEQVNKNSNEAITLVVKIVAVCVTVGAISMLFLI